MTDHHNVQRVDVRMTLDIDPSAWATEYGLDLSEVEHDAEEHIVNTVVAHLGSLGLLAPTTDQPGNLNRSMNVPAPPSTAERADLRAALDLAILAVNTVAHPEATSDAQAATIEDSATQVVTHLARLRDEYTDD